MLHPSTSTTSSISPFSCKRSFFHAYWVLMRYFQRLPLARPSPVRLRVWLRPLLPRAALQVARARAQPRCANNRSQCSCVVKRKTIWDRRRTRGPKTNSTVKQLMKSPPKQSMRYRSLSLRVSLLCFFLPFYSLISLAILLDFFISLSLSSLFFVSSSPLSKCCQL